MSNRIIVPAAFVAVLLWLLALTVETWRVRANEYFGDGSMVSIVSETHVVGIVRAWGVYAIYGRLDDCRIVPLWSPVGDAEKVQCGLTYNEKQTIFRGWYDFRGHPRPFCGALSIQNIPPQCKGE